MPATETRLVIRATRDDLDNIARCGQRLASEGHRFVTRSSAVRAALEAFAAPPKGAGQVPEQAA